MILSEKITELRKRYGMSQEQLGEQIGVSRQAVSKWEMAQSVPDINKIIALANLFGVPTDLLLKDDIELDAPGKAAQPTASADGCVRQVSLEEVSEYLSAREDAAKKTAFALLLFWASPLAGIMLSAANNDRLSVIGAIIDVIMLAAAAAVFVLSRHSMSRFRYLKDENSELAYGVRGAVEERKKSFEHTYLTGLIIGIILLLASVIPLMACSAFTDTNDPAIAACGCLTLLMIAAGSVCVGYVVYVVYVYRGFIKLLKIK